MSSTIRVLLVDPDDIDRDGLKCLLRSAPGIEVVAEASDAAGALDLATAQPPDVMLIDYDALAPHERDGAWLSSVPRTTRSLILCRDDDAASVIDLVEHGVMGVVLKRQSDAVTKAITKVHAGEPWLDRRTVGRLLDARAAHARGESHGITQRIRALSAREREVVCLVGRGCRNRQIAETLGISEATVRNHLTAIFRKLRVADRLTLAVFAHHHHLTLSPGRG